MVFSSLIFLYVFLPVSLVLYYLSPNREMKNAVLILASLVFYAWGEPIWISLLIFSAGVDYINGRIVEKYHGKWQSKLGLISSIVINLSLLSTFKYGGFIIENVNQLLHLQLAEPKFGLPIGISFYSFQTISYVVDVYRKEVPAQKSFWKFLMFVSMFHQLVAGPIVRYKDIAWEIENRVFKVRVFSDGVNRFAIGLAKKVLIANSAGEIASHFLSKDVGTLPVLSCWFGMLLYAFQIYFDFSGYSDMAIGMGKMFGFTYKENFNYPYTSRSATDFWRRWHMSLGTFFRDYLYVPLGGNRRHPVRNLMIVWFLTGLWHGANWNFVLWGLYYGFFIFIEKQSSKMLGTFLPKFKMPRLVSHSYLIVLTLVGWVLFYFEDLSKVKLMVMNMFGMLGNVIVDTELSIYLSNNVYFVLLAILACMPILPIVRKWLLKVMGDNVSDKGVKLSEDGSTLTMVDTSLGILIPILNLVLIGISTMFLIGATYNPFLYFRF